MSTLPRCLSHAVLAGLLIGLCFLSPVFAARKAKSSALRKSRVEKSAKSRKNEKVTKSRQSKKGRRASDDDDEPSSKSRRGRKKVARNSKHTQKGKHRIVNDDADEEQAVNQEREADTKVNYPIVPDRIEVIESGSDAANKLFATHSTRASYTPVSASTMPPVSKRKLEVSMDSARVTEIQQALIKQGYYTGEPTGTWDDTTYESMRRFQFEHKVDVTGYPTAHSLKLLGLTNW